MARPRHQSPRDKWDELPVISNGQGILVDNRDTISIDNCGTTSIGNRYAISIDNLGARDSASVVLYWRRMLNVVAGGLVGGHGKRRHSCG